MSEFLGNLFTQPDTPRTWIFCKNDREHNSQGVSLGVVTGILKSSGFTRTVSAADSERQGEKCPSNNFFLLLALNLVKWTRAVASEGKKIWPRNICHPHFYHLPPPQTVLDEALVTVRFFFQKFFSPSYPEQPMQLPNACRWWCKRMQT